MLLRYKKVVSIIYNLKFFLQKIKFFLQYLGLWYELYRYENAAQVSGDCVTQQLSLNSDGTIRVFNTQEYLVNGTSRSIQGTAKYFDATIQPPQASLSVSFFSFAPSYPNYNVLATDYQNYSIVYSCESAFNNKASSISVFILARQPAVNVTIIYEIIVQILRFNIDARNLRFTVQNPKL